MPKNYVSIENKFYNASLEILTEDDESICIIIHHKKIALKPGVTNDEVDYISRFANIINYTPEVDQVQKFPVNRREVTQMWKDNTFDMTISVYYDQTDKQAKKIYPITSKDLSALLLIFDFYCQQKDQPKLNLDPEANKLGKNQVITDIIHQIDFKFQGIDSIFLGEVKDGQPHGNGVIFEKKNYSFNASYNLRFFGKWEKGTRYGRGVYGQYESVMMDCQWDDNRTIGEMSLYIKYPCEIYNFGNYYSCKPTGVIKCFYYDDNCFDNGGFEHYFGNIGFVKYGLLHAQMKSYDKEGSLQSIIYYWEGVKLNKAIYYDKNGKIIKRISDYSYKAKGYYDEFADLEKVIEDESPNKVDFEGKLEPVLDHNGNLDGMEFCAPKATTNEQDPNELKKRGSRKSIFGFPKVRNSLKPKSVIQSPEVLAEIMKPPDQLEKSKRYSEIQDRKHLNFGANKSMNTSVDKFVIDYYQNGQQNSYDSIDKMKCYNFMACYFDNLGHLQESHIIQEIDVTFSMIKVNQSHPLYLGFLFWNEENKGRKHILWGEVYDSVEPGILRYEGKIGPDEQHIEGKFYDTKGILIYDLKATDKKYK